MAHTETISLRMSAAQKSIIDSAAEACGRSRTAFILESAIDRAQDALLDRRLFVVPPEKWDAFLKVLDGPVDDSAMRRTMETPPPWRK